MVFKKQNRKMNKSGLVAHMVFAFARVGRRASLSGRQALDCQVGVRSIHGVYPDVNRVRPKRDILQYRERHDK